ncbi:MAG: glycosyltransferase [Planctomycetota bacterium]|jgi:glycosyltransferase involved in cell wall biosynthesis
MAEPPQFTLHFITSSLLTAQTANSVAKIEMAKAFCKHRNIKKLYFYLVVENREKLKSLNLDAISEKLIIKPLFFKRYRERALHGKSFWAFCYTLFFVSPVSYLKAFLLALTLPKTDSVFIRDHKSLVGFYLGSLITNIKYAFELHNYSFGKNKITDFFYRRIMKRAKFIVTISKYTKQGWVDNRIDEDKIIVLPSGVNIEDFDGINKNTEQLRDELRLANDKKIITYSGALFENRGIEELLYCASEYEDYLFLFLGGIEKQVKKYQSYIQSRFRRELPNVIFTGYVSHDRIASYLKASDILAAPYSEKVKTLHHMSPVKLIEYLASNVPVITSDLPRIKDIVSEDYVTFFQADNECDLCEKIKLVFNNYERAKAKALQAYENAKNLSWGKRAEKIVDLLRN